jgi:hypothetical protein
MKRSGRPRVDDDDDSVQVCVTLPARQYDYLCEQAQKDRASVPEVIRRQLDPPPQKK